MNGAAMGQGAEAGPIARLLARIVEPALWFAGLLAVWELAVRALEVPGFVLHLIAHDCIAVAQYTAGAGKHRYQV